jgi:magnesium chelatase family protein
MTFAVGHSRALDALQAQAVTVEVHLANGLPSFTLVGLADTEVKESRERWPAGIEAVGVLPGTGDFPQVPANLSGHPLPAGQQTPTRCRRGRGV